MGNLDIYNRVRAVPKEAKSTIPAGRLKGMTNIKPMWRIKVLTENFGVCGFGWRTEIVREWLEHGANDEVSANVEIKLYIKQDGEWSDAIPGIGGSDFVTKERNGLYTDNECYKKAYTDALSVACRSLGIGADVYFDEDNGKYAEPPAQTPVPKPSIEFDPSYNQARLAKLMQDYGIPAKDVSAAIEAVTGAKKRANDLTEQEFNAVVGELTGGAT